MPELQKGQEQLVFLTFILYRYNLSFYYNQVQFVPVFIIEKSRSASGFEYINNYLLFYAEVTWVMSAGFQCFFDRANVDVA